MAIQIMSVEFLAFVACVLGGLLLCLVVALLIAGYMLGRALDQMGEAIHDVADFLDRSTPK